MNTFVWKILHHLIYINLFIAKIGNRTVISNMGVEGEEPMALCAVCVQGMWYHSWPLGVQLNKWPSSHHHSPDWHSVSTATLCWQSCTSTLGMTCKFCPYSIWRNSVQVFMYRFNLQTNIQASSSTILIPLRRSEVRWEFEAWSGTRTFRRGRAVQVCDRKWNVEGRSNRVGGAISSADQKGTLSISCGKRASAQNLALETNKPPPCRCKSICISVSKRSQSLWRKSLTKNGK